MAAKKNEKAKTDLVAETKRILHPEDQALQAAADYQANFGKQVNGYLNNMFGVWYDQKKWSAENFKVATESLDGYENLIKKPPELPKIVADNSALKSYLENKILERSYDVAGLKTREIAALKQASYMSAYEVVMLGAQKASAEEGEKASAALSTYATDRLTEIGA